MRINRFMRNKWSISLSTSFNEGVIVRLGGHKIIYESAAACSLASRKTPTNLFTRGTEVLVCFIPPLNCILPVLIVAFSAGGHLSALPWTPLPWWGLFCLNPDLVVIVVVVLFLPVLVSSLLAWESHGLRPSTSLTSPRQVGRLAQMGYILLWLAFRAEPVALPVPPLCSLPVPPPFWLAHLNFSFPSAWVVSLGSILLTSSWWRPGGKGVLGHW